MARTRPTRLLLRVLPLALGILVAAGFASPGEAATSYQEQTLYSFCSKSSCSDGATPWAGLIFGTVSGTTGTLYGTTSQGGANGFGTVFQVANGMQTVLYSFCPQTGCADGATPLGGLIMDSSGNLYGTTSDGGTLGCNYNSPLSGCGTVFKLAPPYTGPPTILHTFGGYSALDASSPAASLILSGGYLYGTASSGGTQNAGAVFRLETSGSGYSLLYSFCSQTDCADGAYPMDLAGSLITDTSGNLYGTAANGGNGLNAGTAFKLTPSSTPPWTETVLHTFCSSADCTTDGATPIAGLIIDLAGNLYGTTEYGGANSAGIVFRLTSTGSSLTNLYDFCAQSNCTDGEYPVAGVTMDSAGNLYGTTYYGGANGVGTAFQLAPSSSEPWPEPFVYSFTGGADGEYPFAGLTLNATTGELYGTAQYGGNATIDPSGGGTAFALVPTPATLSSGTQCNGRFTGSFTGNITVSAGQSCIFTPPCGKGGITGNVTVDGGSFENLGCPETGNLIENGGYVALGPMATLVGNLSIGNLSTPTASSFSLAGSKIVGNLQVQKVTTGQTPETVCGMQFIGNLLAQNNLSLIVIGNNAQTCAGSSITGNLQALSNSDGLSIDYNEITGNLQALSNGPMTIDVSANKITGTLQCQGNTTVTDMGGPNRALVNIGQCAIH
jgi:uncharacterized repeat protein (TIGR03803 family)